MLDTPSVLGKLAPGANNRNVGRVFAASINAFRTGLCSSDSSGGDSIIGANVTSARGYAVDHFFRGTFGPRPGQRLIRDLPASSGLTYNNPVRVLQGYGAGAYLLVP